MLARGDAITVVPVGKELTTQQAVPGRRALVHGAIDAEAGSLARLQLNLLATFAELEPAPAA